MAKVLNVVFGIGTAVVVFILILLAIQAIYPEVKYEDYCNVSAMSQPIYFPDTCSENMTVGECRMLMKVPEQVDMQCQQDYDSASKSHNKSVFIIASIIGAILILAAFFMLTLTNISAGIMCSGIVLLIFAFSKGWNSADDILKLAIGAVIAALVIVLALVANKRLAKK